MAKMCKRIIGKDIARDLFTEEPTRNIISVVQLEQILLNLVVNARDAIGEKGRVTLETATVLLDEQAVAHHAGARPGRYVLLSVSDNGVGMSEEVQQRMYEPFFTTREIGRGAGLGLATVYGIVKQYHGIIDTVSKLHKGTTVKVYLPAGETEERPSLFAS